MMFSDNKNDNIPSCHRKGADSYFRHWEEVAVVDSLVEEDSIAGELTEA